MRNVAGETECVEWIRLQAVPTSVLAPRIAKLNRFQLKRIATLYAAGQRLCNAYFLHRKAGVEGNGFGGDARVRALGG